jgi:HEAT repeat protein
MNLELLTMDSPRIQEYAIKNLGKLGDPRAIDVLVARLYDPDPEVRNAAAWALGEIRSPYVIDSLLAVVNTGMDYDLSCYAVSALLKIVSRCPDMTPRGEACTDDTIAGKVTDYLVNRAETDPLIATIVSDSLFDNDVDVRILAAQILAHIATEGVRGALEEAAMDDEDERVRETAGRALAGLGSPPLPEPEHVFPKDIIYQLVEEEYLPKLLQEME